MNKYPNEIGQETWVHSLDGGTDILWVGVDVTSGFVPSLLIKIKGERPCQCPEGTEAELKIRRPLDWEDRPIK